MKALVLGGSGFVGLRLVEQLVGAGHHVTVLNRGRSSAELPSSVLRLIADRTDGASMRAALTGTTWDAVFDVSGFVMAAGGSDVDALLELFDGRVGRYVYVSSIMAYDQGLSRATPWTEDLPVDVSGPGTYGGFKALAETTMLARHVATGFPVSIVRPAAIYGPHNNIHDMEGPMFLRLLQGRPILLPHAGLVTASYGHVDDLCDALVTMVEASRAVGEVFNVTADAVTTQCYVETLARVVGVEPDIVPIPDDLLAALPAGVYGHLFSTRHHAVLSIDKVAERLGVRPGFDLETGHRQTYEWFRGADRHVLEGPLVDPLWRATWDFDAEAAAAAMVR